MTDCGRGVTSLRKVRDRGTTVVSSYPQGVSPYGVMDCTGNVWEWCRDWFSPDYYHHLPNRDPLGPESREYYVVRGGSWYRGRRSMISVRTSVRFRLVRESN
jgi:formylglycine-generating enzyme required for sulfatase activity